MDDGSDTGRTNEEIRTWYKEQASRISESNKQWIGQDISAEDRARMAWDLRRTARLDARSMMADRAEVERPRKRDEKKYGDPDGPTFEWLFEKLVGRGLEGDAIFEAIIEGASSRTNVSIDKQFGLK